MKALYQKALYNYEQLLSACLFTELPFLGSFTSRKISHVTAHLKSLFPHPLAQIYPLFLCPPILGVIT